VTYYDAASGHLDPSAYSSASVHARELQTVFHDAWLFVGPEEWAQQPGDFYTSCMGATPVIVWRCADGDLRVLVNQCRGSTDAITSVDRGHARSLACPCHGWAYSPDQPSWLSAGFADCYRGLVFATLSADAPDLIGSLGAFSWYLNLILDGFAGGVELYGGAPLRWRVRGNWKLASQEYCGDPDRQAADAPVALSGFQASTGAGAVVVATDTNDATGMRPLAATLFPNLSFDGPTQTLHVWHPTGPSVTDVDTYCLVGRDHTAAAKEAARQRCQFHFGPTGLQSGDHERVWESITAASRGLLARRHRLSLRRGMGGERKLNIPGLGADLASEMNQRSFFAWWEAELAKEPRMDGRSWLSLGPRPSPASPAPP
jgi:hypothetical protein